MYVCMSMCVCMYVFICKRGILHIGLVAAKDEDLILVIDNKIALV